MSSKLKVVIMGAGAVCHRLYLPAFSKCAGLSLRAVVDRRPLTRHTPLPDGAESVQADFEEFFKSGASGLEFDAVVVTLPNSLHQRCVSAALEAGYHVLCEKPLSLSAEVCRRLGRLASERRRVLAAGMVRRIPASFCAMKECLASGELGTVRNIQFEDGAPYEWPVESPAAFLQDNGGVLADIGIHYLDQLQSLFGKLKPLEYEDDAKGGVEANALLKFETQLGVPGTLRVSRARHLGNRQSIVCEHGTVWTEKDVFDGCFVQRGSRSNWISHLRPAGRSDLPTSLEQAMIVQLEKFARSIASDTVPEVSASEAAESAGVVEWAYRQREVRMQARSKDEPILVTGATGFIGTALVERLHDTGTGPVTVAVRDYRTCSSVARFPVAIEKVDLLDRTHLRRLMRGRKAVFHLAYGRDGADAERMTVEGTHAVVEAAIDEGVECVVVLSSIYVLGRSRLERELDEQSPYDPVGGEYGAQKTEMERWVLSRSESSLPTRLVVLNPSCVYGPGGTTYVRLPVSLAKGGEFAWIDGGAGTANYTYIENLLDAMTLASSRPEAHGRRFIINDGSTSWREFLGPILAGFEIPNFSSEQWTNLQAGVRQRSDWRDVLRAAARSPDLIAAVNRHPVLKAVKKTVFRKSRRLKQDLLAAQQQPVFGHKPAAPPDWLFELMGPFKTTYSSRLARQVLHWSPHVTLEEGQKRTLEWLKRQGLV